MRIIASSIALILLAAGTAQAKPQLAPETQLGEALKGRVAEKPVDCINLRDIRSSRIFSRTAILYETTGGVYYVNRPTSGAYSLARDQVLVTDTRSPQLCSIDIVHLYDNGIHMRAGSVGLGKFEPYRKPRAQ